MIEFLPNQINFPVYKDDNKGKKETKYNEYNNFEQRMIIKKVKIFFTGKRIIKKE